MNQHQSNEHQATWEEHYNARPQVWSGKVNTQLAAIAPTIGGGRALDLGCGEGADAIWLAEQGWTVVAVDVSDTALGRARAAAEARGVGDRIDFQQHELTGSFPDGTFDLVSAQFLHSTLEMDRTGILRRAAAAVAPGGALLVVDHAGAPPWATKMHHHRFPGAQEVIAGLFDCPELNLDQWTTEIRSVERPARGPDGDEVILVDNVILIRRNS
ncbi:class I SAM-dependent methyltransferase [Mycolicibacterium sp.]|uniref:class I SAM-dependent methyltransferase n=1 Tax=Mycolicibacterium sp. TaxID=2320850 RepID=UPI0028A9957D|nr:class I SAM-dependent methyltransferase [Mycolicibacterium sp.]